MMRSILALAAVFVVGSAHMSMQFPYPRDNGGAYAVWQQNEPMVPVHPATCHGLTADATVRTGNAFAAGDIVTIDIYGSAPHAGGHCAFWYSTDDITFTKIVDVVDCTLAADGAVQVLLPSNMPTQCLQKCTFAWSWSPVNSGGCEVYMNCADISVSGVTGGGETGGINVDFANIADGTTACVRVDTTTHLTPIFSTSKTDYESDEGTATGNTVAPDESQIEEDIEDDPDALCPNPNAPNQDGPINTNTGVCCDAANGNCDSGNRCDDGMCCSSAGFCGPEIKSYDSGTETYVYINYDTDPDSEYATSIEAFAAYCDAGMLADYRLVDCDTTKYPTSAPTMGGAAAFATRVALATMLAAALVQ